MSDLPARLLALETQVWAAAQAGDVAADLRLLSPDFLGVYAAGWAGREVHAAQMGSGPSVDTFELSRVRVLALADGVGLISYLADFTVPGSEQALKLRVSSVWRLDEGGEWRNMFSQDTEVPRPDGPGHAAPCAGLSADADLRSEQDHDPLAGLPHGGERLSSIRARALHALELLWADTHPDSWWSRLAASATAHSGN